MPLTWPGAQMIGGNLGEDRRAQIVASLDRYSRQIENGLAALGLRPFVSLLWQPWNLAVIWDRQAVWCVFSPNKGGTAIVDWLENDHSWNGPQIRDQVSEEYGWNQVEVHRLPHPGSPSEAAELAQAARTYVTAVERSARVARLGDDIKGVESLEPQLRQFLDDHPDPERNVFVMMRFDASDQHQQVRAAIVKALEDRGMEALRADGRVYTDDLWDNIRIYMTGCKYGIAVFEEINERYFNPNVSLELGYMLGHNKRCLLLKETHLERLPTDVVGKLYKTFDHFDIEPSVHDAVAQWVDTDLGLKFR